MISAKRNGLKLVNDAQKLWNHLNGVICVYKPSGLTVNQTRMTLMSNLCRGKQKITKITKNHKIFKIIVF